MIPADFRQVLVEGHEKRILGTISGEYMQELAFHEENLAHKLMKQNGHGVTYYWNHCSELVDDLLHWAEEEGILLVPVWMTGTLYPWGFCCHHVVMCDGVVHDMLCPEPKPLEEYLRWMFKHPRSVYVEVGEEIWSGQTISARMR